MPKYERPSFEALRERGILHPIPDNTASQLWTDERDTLAMDAALNTVPNAAVPAELLIYWEPRAIEVLTRKHAATEVFPEVSRGTWVTPVVKFRVSEWTGSTQPYVDFGESRTTRVNYNWVERSQYVFQTMIEYGDFEVATASEARINLVSDEQTAAAYIINTDANRFYLRGVAGHNIYGLLNIPTYTAAIPPQNTGTGNSPLWANKDLLAIYNDALFLFQNLEAQTDGKASEAPRLKLLMSPAARVDLLKASTYNTSVEDLLKKGLPNLEIITIPELGDDPSGESIYLIADGFEGRPTAELGFSDKLRPGRIVPATSSFKQKWTSTTYGCFMYYPMFVAIMKGIR